MSSADPDAILALLPAWAAWLRPAVFSAAAFATAYSVTWLGTHVALPRARHWRDAHWTERARRTYPARSLTALLPMLCVGMFPALALWLDRPRALDMGFVPVLLIAVAGLIGGSAAAAPLLANISGRPRSRLDHAWSAVGTPFLMAPPLFVVGAMAATIGPQLDTMGVVATVSGLIAFAAASRFGSLPLLRVLRAVRPASQRLAVAVERAANETAITPRSVEEIRLPFANAFAFPWSGALVFTREAVDCLDDDALFAVACHELGHLSESRSALFIRLIPTTLFLPFGFARPLFAAGGWVALATVYVIALVGALIVTRWLRGLEARADDVAHQHEADSGVYAQALERIYERNLMPAVLGSRRAVHPELYDRMQAAGVTPDYPRPAPPSSKRAAVGAIAGMAALVPLAVLTASLAWSVPDLLVEADGRVENAAIARVAMTGGSTQSLRWLASAWVGTGRLPEASEALRVATALSPADHTSLALSAQVAGLRGQCGEGSARLRDAQASLIDPQHADDCPWIKTALAVIASRCHAPDAVMPEPLALAP